MLYIPFHKFKYLGGPSTFMKNLKDYLDEVGYQYSNSFWKAKGIFFPMGYRPQTLWVAKRLAMKIIQRLDGVYYPSKHGSNYIKLNRLQKNNYQKYSDYIIFQSVHSRDQCFNMFGEIPNNRYSIIYNGVNTKIFYPDKKIQDIKSKIKFITTGSFRNIDMIEPIILALDYLKKNYNFELHIVGPILNKDLGPYFDRDYIVYHNSKDLKGVAELLRSSHIFLYSHLNPPCPNSVIEAIATGLPVVGFDSGAMAELCHFSKDLLAYVTDDVFQKYEDFDYKKLAEKIEFIIIDFTKYKEIALNHTNEYSFYDCGRKYVEVFNKLLN